MIGVIIASLAIFKVSIYVHHIVNINKMYKKFICPPDEKC